MYQIVFLRNSCFAFIFLFLSCVGKREEMKLPYYDSPDFTPIFCATKREASEKVKHIIPSFSFIDQNGKPFTQNDIEGKVHVANFIFTRCVSICPIMSKNMKLVQDAFQNNINVILLSYSVMPWIDSVHSLKAYAENYSINSFNWHLLTGNKNEIYTLARQGYFAEEDLGFTKDSADFLHTEHVLLIDQTKRIRGIYNGTLQLEMEQLIKDIKLLVD